MPHRHSLSSSFAFQSIPFFGSVPLSFFLCFFFTFAVSFIGFFDVISRSARFASMNRYLFQILGSRLEFQNSRFPPFHWGILGKRDAFDTRLSDILQIPALSAHYLDCFAILGIPRDSSEIYSQRPILSGMILHANDSFLAGFLRFLSDPA